MALYLTAMAQSAKIDTFEKCERAGWLIRYIKVYDGTGPIEKECVLWTGQHFVKQKSDQESAIEALRSVVAIANELSGIKSGAVFNFEIADTDGHFANFGLVRYVNEVKADPVVEEHAVTFRETGKGSTGNAEVDSVTNQVVSMHRRTVDFGGELSVTEIEQRARQFLERVYPDFKTVEPSLTFDSGMKGSRLNNGNYLFRWNDLNYAKTLPDGVHTDVDPFVQVGITSSGFIFSYDNTVNEYRNARINNELILDEQRAVEMATAHLSFPVTVIEVKKLDCPGCFAVKLQRGDNQRQFTVTIDDWKIKN